MTSNHHLLIYTAMGISFSLLYLPVALLTIGAFVALTVLPILRYFPEKAGQNFDGEPLAGGFFPICDKNEPNTIFATKSVTFFTVTKSLSQKVCQTSCFDEKCHNKKPETNFHQYGILRVRAGPGLVG